MIKKVKKPKNSEIEDLEVDFNEENIKNQIDEVEEDIENENSEIQINDDDDDEDIDLIIEINENDLDIITDEKIEIIDNDVDDIILSKHKIEGKHSLKYDSIFKGKQEDPPNESDIDMAITFRKDTIEVDKSSQYYFESIDNEKYIRSKLVKEKVYIILEKHTNINFLNNRRKPSRNDFNNYYLLLKIHLKDESFTNIELFNELAVYFSDNLFNMFKLLDNKWRNLIITELQDHIGKTQNSKEITNRNIYEGTEIEFSWIDEVNNCEKIITGVVMETDYESSTFNVDSYENMYEVHISMITKILNNTKFRYNLNKLDNIDFI